MREYQSTTYQIEFPILSHKRGPHFSCKAALIYFCALWKWSAILENTYFHKKNLLFYFQKYGSPSCTTNWFIHRWNLKYFPSPLLVHMACECPLRVWLTQFSKKRKKNSDGKKIMVIFSVCSGIRSHDQQK